jgi:hypothetical protein
VGNGEGCVFLLLGWVLLLIIGGIVTIILG